MLLTRRSGPGRLAVVAVTLCAAGCSDAATRVAYDIESGTRKLATREGARADISHAPRSWPAGCAGSYTLRIEKGSSTSEGLNNFRTVPGSGGLSVNCYRQDGNAHGYGTTYHLRFVNVPATVEISKKEGETAFIEVQRVSGRATVVGVH